jgi:hypothetical protein
MVGANDQHIPNRLFPLRFPNLGLHITFGENVVKTRADDSPLKLSGPSGPLLRQLLFDAFAVFASIEYSPRNLTGVAAHKVCRLCLRVQEDEHLIHTITGKKIHVFAI